MSKAYVLNVDSNNKSEYKCKMYCVYCICIHPNKIQRDRLPGVGRAAFKRKTIEEEKEKLILNILFI